MTVVGRTRGSSFYDPDTLKGRWTYRIGIAANWVDDENLGDVMVVSKPATITGLG
jgi:hypothetical protein